MPNKAQFIEVLADRFEGDKKRAAAALDAVIDTVYMHVAKGEKVALTGFGIFEKRDRAARTARNPATGAAVKVKKTSVPGFRPGAEFRAITSGARKLPKPPTKTAAKKVAAAPARKVAATKVAAPAKKAAAPAKKVAAAPAKKVAAKAAPVAKKVAAPAKKVAAKAAPVAKKVAAPAKKAAPVAKKTAAPAKKAPAKRAR